MDDNPHAQIMAIFVGWLGSNEEYIFFLLWS